MSFHASFPRVERNTPTPPLAQEHLVLGEPPKEKSVGTGERLVGFLKTMVGWAIAGAQLYSPLHDPARWQR